MSSQEYPISYYDPEAEDDAEDEADSGAAAFDPAVVADRADDSRAVDFHTEDPPDLQLAALRDPNLRIAKPFAVNFHAEEDQVVAVADEVEEYGAGANESEAVQELQHALAELYHSLQEDPERLGPGLQETWTKIQEHIQPRPEG